MQFIAHRINTISELQALPENVGIELDLRDVNQELVLQHDPFKTGENFETYLQAVQNQLMILNIKSERIEPVVLNLLKKYNKSNFFFLDSSFPMIINLIEKNETRIATRYSEYESIETVLSLQNKVEWVWIDCFTKLPLTPESAHTLKAANFKLCLVSPDLLGRPEEIKKYAQFIYKNNIQLDAICTKIQRIAEWKNELHLT